LKTIERGRESEEGEQEIGRLVRWIGWTEGKRKAKIRGRSGLGEIRR
jgi:hypothetical protein